MQAEFFTWKIYLGSQLPPVPDQTGKLNKEKSTPQNRIYTTAYV